MAGRVYTAIEPFRVFHMAEDYHQKYYYKQWAGRVPDRGKLPVGELRAAFHEWYGA
jgi:peptide methionine sulfoxide reductase MsrA